MANRRKKHRGIWGVIGAIFFAGLACQTLLDPPGNNPQPQSYTPIDPYWLSFSELPADGGVLDGEHCDPFCIMGLYPYSSTRADFDQIVEQYGWNCNSDLNDLYFGCRSDLWIMHVSIEYESDVVEAVSIKPNELTLGEIIEVHGKPSYLDLSASDLGFPTLFFEECMFLVRLHKTYHYASLSNEAGYSITADSKIYDIDLFSPTYFPSGETAEGAIPWEGYGIYFTTGKATKDT